MHLVPLKLGPLLAFTPTKKLGHRLSNIARTAPVSRLPLPRIKARIARHELHVVDFHCVRHDLEHRPVVVGVETLAYRGRRGTSEIVFGVRGGKMLACC